MTPAVTFQILLAVQALHLLHHRLAKRHISFTEVLSAMLLCLPLSSPLPASILMIAHLAVAGLQVVGSLSIRRFSPDWNAKE